MCTPVALTQCLTFTSVAETGTAEDAPAVAAEKESLTIDSLLYIDPETEEITETNSETQESELVQYSVWNEEKLAPLLVSARGKEIEVGTQAVKDFIIMKAGRHSSFAAAMLTNVDTMTAKINNRNVTITGDIDDIQPEIADKAQEILDNALAPTKAQYPDVDFSTIENVDFGPIGEIKGTIDVVIDTADDYDSTSFPVSYTISLTTGETLTADDFDDYFLRKIRTSMECVDNSLAEGEGIIPDDTMASVRSGDLS